MRCSSVLGALWLTFTTAGAIPTISTKGSKFFTSEGNQWFVRGVAYQLVPDDPLIDNDQCKLDAALMEELGANAIRVYHVDPNADHDDCMSTFADAGIYLFLDLDTFDTQIEQNDAHWNRTQRDAFAKVMDAFYEYDNLAGFFVGNEVLTHPNGSVAAPFVKAAVRDMKAHRDEKNYRKIPIGYSAADISTLRPNLQNYLACGSDRDEAIDFFALNAYEWCGETTFAESGYVSLTNEIKNYPVPIFFSETGCIVPRPRTFDDQPEIYGPRMNQYWSGSIVYEWIEEANNYGIISYGPKVDPAATDAPPDGFTRSGTPTPVSPDFPNLSSHWATPLPSGIRENEYSPNLTPPPCPPRTSGVWNVDGSAALPSLGQTFNSAAPTVTDDSTSDAAPSATPTKTGAASPAREVKGVAVGLAGVFLGVAWWL
ncbi:glycoside hydrolase family 72 protein [Patellaria atrata CBS 101060]|uniref:1,3-beta-glucanosyltransferase n=1 Tax=Patellaria atrata CBS 101060 TaxID=1346257 RepID=A0A9P4SFA1_9PEZI|nr:glycoside hydrolase family 72 protein [Patellaria atrata CBS 101060]